MDPFLDEERGGGNRFDPLAILRMFWRRKWLFFVPFVLCLAMAYVAIRTMTPIYESAGQIRLVVEMTGSRLIEGDARVTRARDIDRMMLANIWSIVTAPKFLEQVVRETGLHTGRAHAPQDFDAALVDMTQQEIEAVQRAANRLAAMIRVRQDGQQFYWIGVRNTDPKQAFVLARVVLDRFLEEERATRMAPRTTTRDFLARQRLTYEQALKVAEDSLSAFQRTILTETLAGNPINVVNLNQAESSLLNLQDQFYNADINEMARLEQQARAVLGQAPAIGGMMRDPSITRTLQELRDLEFARLVGSSTGAGGSDLGQARLRLNSLIEARVNQDYAQLGLMDRNRLTQYLYFMVYREAKEQVIETLSRHIRNYRDFTTRQPVQSQRLADLQDEVASRRNLLESIEREITQQTINLEASLAEIGYRIEVRRDVEHPKYPVEPDKMRLSFMGFALSIAIGFGLVVLSIMLDRSFTAVADIERVLQVNVIGTLPVIQDEHFERKRRLRLLRWLVLVVLILSVAGVFLLYIYPRLS